MKPPSLEDVISMILEDVSVLGNSFTSSQPETSGRRLLHTTASHTSPMRGRALRAHHLPHNRFIRPRHHRQLVEQDDPLGDLLDKLSISGGYDGSKIFFRFELDVSKQSISSLEEIIQKPLDLLKEVEFLKNLFPSAAGVGGTDSHFQLDTDISFAASAHVGVLGESIDLYDWSCVI